MQHSLQDYFGIPFQANSFMHRNPCLFRGETSKSFKAKVGFDFNLQDTMTHICTHDSKLANAGHCDKWWHTKGVVRSLCDNKTFSCKSYEFPWKAICGIGDTSCEVLGLVHILGLRIVRRTVRVWLYDVAFWIRGRGERGLVAFLQGVRGGGESKRFFQNGPLLNHVREVKGGEDGRSIDYNGLRGVKNPSFLLIRTIWTRPQWFSEICW